MMQKHFKALFSLLLMLVACQPQTPSRLMPSGPPASTGSSVFLPVSPNPPNSSTQGGIGTSSSGLFAGDPNLSAPRISSVEVTDNAVILYWRDDVNTAHDGYMLCFFSCSERSVFEISDKNTRSTWFVEIPYLVSTPGGATQELYPLIPGASIDLNIAATSNLGISGLDSRRTTLTTPTITIGDPTGSTISPAAFQAFAVWDADNNGLVNDASGSGGVFPLYPSNIGPDSVALAGNEFDQNSNVRANIIVGYFFTGFNNLQFVAFHLFIDPATNQANPVSVLFGDALPGDVGTLVWVGSAQTFQAQVVGQGTANTPNIVQGSVTAPTLASNGTNRIIEFTFRLALLLQ